jgi:Flp pilus assembly protein TadD
MPARAYKDGLRLSAEGRHADAIDCLQIALAQRPGDSRVLFALGNTARALGMAAPAEMFYRQVLALEPERLEALINLSNLLRANSDPGGAIALLEPAAFRAPAAPEIWLALGSAHREMGAHDVAENHYREALALKPDFVPALVNLADLLSDAGKREDAQAFYARALALEPGNADAQFHRGFLHLEHGDLAQGWRDYEARLAVDPIAHYHRLPRWHGEPGKKVLVTPEQGVGDELMFASVIGDLTMRCDVTLECDPRLVPLFARSFPNAVVHPSRVQKVGAAITAHHEPGDADCTIEMGSLAMHLRASLADFPAPHAYLVPDTQEKAHWSGVFANGPHIGICWRSGLRTNGRAMHYAPLEAWAAFIRDLPGTIVCAQYDADAEEIRTLEKLSERKILVLQGIGQKKELDRTCAMLSALDCVVSAPTAVSWLAAGAGVATYKILARRNWTSFGTGHEPFAPSCQCMTADGEWANAFSKTSTNIKARLQ